MSIRQILFATSIACLVMSVALAVEAMRFYLMHNVRGVRNDLMGRMRLDAVHIPARNEAGDLPTEVVELPTEVVEPAPVAKAARASEKDDAKDSVGTVAYRPDRGCCFVVAQRLQAYDINNVLHRGGEES